MLVIVVRNFVFRVYLPTIIDDECGRNMSFDVYPINFNGNSENYNTSVLWSRVVWVTHDMFREHLCSLHCLEKDFCNDVVNSEFSFKEPVDVPKCISFYFTLNSSAVLDIFCDFDHKRIADSNDIKCEVIQDGNVLSVDSIYNNSPASLSALLNINTFCAKKGKKILYPTIPLQCNLHCSHFKNNIIQKLRIFDYSILIFAILLHLVTLAVFRLVPRLQAGYGKSVMSYVAAQTVKKAAVIVMIAVLKDIHAFQRITIYGKLSSL